MAEGEGNVDDWVVIARSSTKIAAAVAAAAAAAAAVKTG
jgi:hypothetical protein